MKRVIKLMILKGSLVGFTVLLLSVSATPVGTPKLVYVDTTDLKVVRDYNEKTLKKIDHEFQRASQFFKY
jgi:hypothetical protein